MPEVPFIYELTFPLYGFESEEEVTDLPDTLEIKAFSQGDKRRLHDSLCDVLPITSSFWFQHCKFRLLRRTERNLGHDVESRTESIVEASRLLTALRLLHSGAVGTSGAIMPTLIEGIGVSNFFRPMNEFQLDDNSLSTLIENPYQLASDEIAKFKRLYLMVSDPPKTEALKIALRRFNFSYSRSEKEDRVIDLSITLESCLVPGGGATKKKCIAGRSAALLGDEQRDASAVYSFLENFYDARNDVVHEGKSINENMWSGQIHGEQVTVEQFMAKGEQITREILCRYLDLLNADNALAAVNGQIGLWSANE
jgi:hypothetical protein